MILSLDSGSARLAICLLDPAPEEALPRLVQALSVPVGSHVSAECRYCTGPKHPPHPPALRLPTLRHVHADEAEIAGHCAATLALARAHGVTRAVIETVKRVHSPGAGTDLVHTEALARAIGATLAAHGIAVEYVTAQRWRADIAPGVKVTGSGRATLDPILHAGMRGCPVDWPRAEGAPDAADARDAAGLALWATRTPLEWHERKPRKPKRGRGERKPRAASNPKIPGVSRQCAWARRKRAAFVERMTAEGLPLPRGGRKARGPSPDVDTILWALPTSGEARSRGWLARMTGLGAEAIGRAIADGARDGRIVKAARGFCARPAAAA